MFKPSSVDVGELLTLVKKHLLPNRRDPMETSKGGYIPTPNTNEIIVLSSFFQCLPTCEFLHGLLHYYYIELIHLNPNSILQIIIFVHLFKHYLFLKYQLSVANWKVIGGVGIQTHPHSDLLDLLMKTSLKGCHKSWFYCENQEPNLPFFVGRLPKYNRN
jgi:hypothetical protein